MEPIEIIKDKTALEGTCYIELSLGKYQGKHWQEGSLFFDEEVFGLIEYIFAEHIPQYDHYAMNDADYSAWQKILEDLKTLSNTLNHADEFQQVMGKVGFTFGGSRDYFQIHFDACKTGLIRMLKELIVWAEQNVERHRYIAILGI